MTVEKIEPTTEEETAAALEQATEAAAFEASFAGEEPAIIEPEVKDLAPVDPVVEDAKEEKEAAPLDPYTVLEQKMSDQIRKLNGTIGNLNAKVLAQAEKTAELESAKTPTPEALNIAFKDGEKFQELKREFPQWGEAMEESMTTIQQQVLASRPSEPTFDQAAFREEVKAELAETARLLPLDVKYPSWRETVNTPEFQEWMGKQDVAVQALANSDVPQHAIALLDRHASFSAPEVQNTNTNRLENAVAPTSGKLATPTPPTKTENDEFEAGFKDG